MFYEKAGRFGDRISPFVGVGLLSLAAAVLVWPAIPMFAG
jgi:hypothetical protein